MSRFTSAERRRLKAKAVKMYVPKNGRRVSVREIARTLDVHYQTVAAWLVQEGVDIKKTRYDHEKIAADIRAGAKQVEIVRKYRCSWDFVRRLRQKVNRGEI